MSIGGTGSSSTMNDERCELRSSLLQSTVVDAPLTGDAFAVVQYCV